MTMQNKRYTLLKNTFHISDRTLAIMEEVEVQLAARFAKVEENAEINQLKVLAAFQNNRISYAHLGETTGYGYDDLGRDALDQVYADVFGAEDAMVRHTIVSGTQAIAACLYAVLRPGDTLLSVVGKPYDTMEEVIGIRGDGGMGSLMDFGISYAQIDLMEDGRIDHSAIYEKVKHDRIKAVLIQRSRGYDWRDSLCIDEIGAVIQTVKKADPETICIVDNCYGEFVETREPTEVGADLAVGSLIKNPGGSLALSGGYIVGKSAYVDLVGYRLTAPGLGKHVGASLGMNRSLYQGFYMAPHIVAESLKTAIFCAGMFEKLGFAVCPASDAVRTDIIQAIRLDSAENVIRFCQAIQKGSPIDSFVLPEPWEMPGYGDPVIMAAGAFVQGASIELSADAPVCEPYIAYMQGGVIYEAAKIGILKAAESMLKKDDV